MLGVPRRSAAHVTRSQRTGSTLLHTRTPSALDRVDAKLASSSSSNKARGSGSRSRRAASGGSHTDSEVDAEEEAEEEIAEAEEIEMSQRHQQTASTESDEEEEEEGEQSGGSDSDEEEEEEDEEEEEGEESETAADGEEGTAAAAAAGAADSSASDEDEPLASLQPAAAAAAGASGVKRRSRKRRAAASESDSDAQPGAASDSEGETTTRGKGRSSNGGSAPTTPNKKQTAAAAAAAATGSAAASPVKAGKAATPVKSASAAAHSAAAAASPARAAQHINDGEKGGAAAAGDVEMTDAVAEGDEAHAAAADDTNGAEGQDEEDQPIQRPTKAERREQRREKKRQKKEEQEALARDLDIPDSPEEDRRSRSSASAPPSAESTPPHSPAVRSRLQLLPLTDEPAVEEADFSMSQTQADAAPAAFVSAKLIQDGWESEGSEEQREGLRLFQQLFAQEVAPAETVEARATAAAQAAQEPHAVRLVRRRARVASVLLGAVSRQIMEKDVAERAIATLRSKLYLLPVAECVRLMVHTMAMWRVSFLTRSACFDRCKAALAVDIFPALFSRCMQNDEIDGTRAWQGDDVDKMAPSHFQAQLCSEQWRGDLTADILAMVQDLNLTDAQYSDLIEFVCTECMPTLGQEELVTVSFRLWLMASHGERDKVLRATMERCAELESGAREALRRAAVKPESLALTQQSSVAADDAARNVREMEETCMMAVLHFDQAVKVDPVSKSERSKFGLGTVLLDLLSTRELQLTTVPIGCVLGMMRHAQWTKKCVDFLWTYFYTFFTSRKPPQSTSSSSWLTALMRPVRSLQCVDVVQLVHQLISSKATGVHPTILQSLMQLGLALLDRAAVSAHVADKSDVVILGVDLTSDKPQEYGRTPQEQAIQTGADILFKLFLKHKEVGKDVVCELLSRIDSGSASAAGIPAIRLLQKLINDKQTRYEMREYGRQIMSSLEWLHCQTPAAGLLLIKALLPLLREQRDLRDFAIRTCHKLMFLQHTDARLLSVDAYFALVACPYTPHAGMIRGSSAFQSSQSAGAAGASHDAAAVVDVEFFLSGVNMFRRALSQPQGEVRERVYKGLNQLFHDSAELRPYILELLLSHLQRYLPDKKEARGGAALNVSASCRAPLKLDLALDASKTRVAEPLSLLLSTVQAMLMAIGMERIPRPADGGAEFPLHQQESMDVEQRSAALLRLHTENLLSRLIQAGSLKELGINELFLLEANSDDPAGVSAVLQAQVLHGVLCSSLEWILQREADAERRSIRSASLPSATSASSAVTTSMSAEACRKFLHVFDLFWQLHQILSQHTKAPKPSADKAKGGSGKKKKRSRDEEEEEEEEEDEEEEEEDEEDEDEDDDESPRKKKAGKAAASSKGKKGKKGAASKGKKKRAAKPKAPPKAIHELCRRGRWKPYVITGTTVDQLLHLSTEHTGAPLHAASGGRHSVHISSSQGSSSSKWTENREKVGDALFHHIALQEWTLQNLLEVMHGWAESGQRKEKIAYLKHIGPHVMPLVRHAQAYVEHERTTEKEGEKKKKKKMAFPLLACNVLLQTIRMALSDELDESAHPLVDVLLALLPVESHSQVLENDGVHVSFAKLLNWCQNRVEKHVTKMIEFDAVAEAQCGMQTLLLLITAMPWLDDRRLMAVTDKRNAWAGETCTNEVHDGALFVSLLEYLYTIQSSPDTQLELVRSVALRLVDSEEELTQQVAERFDQLANPNLKTAKKMMEWCEGRVRAALDEIDIIVTEVRKAGKNGHESKTARSQKKQAVTRLGELMSICHLLLLSRTVEDGLLRLIIRLYKTLTKTTKMLSAVLDGNVPSEFEQLSKDQCVSLRPALEQYTTIVMSTRDADDKEKSAVKIKRHANLLTQISKCAEQWDCALLSFTHKCKKMKVHRGSNLDKYVRSSAGMDINIVQRTPLSSSLKHERASPLKKAQPPSPARPSPRRSSSSSSSQHAPSPRRHNESLLSRKTPASESAPMDVDGEAEDIEEDDGNVKEEEEEDIEE